MTGLAGLVVGQACGAKHVLITDGNDNSVENLEIIVEENKNLNLIQNVSSKVRLAHYSKSQIFVQKFNFDKTPTFSRVFHQTFFLTIFLVKSPDSHHFHEFFTQKNDNFHGKLKLNFWTKNEDFEQCA